MASALGDLVGVVMAVLLIVKSRKITEWLFRGEEE
jgi:hypothetical protein